MKNDELILSLSDMVKSVTDVVVQVKAAAIAFVYESEHVIADTMDYVVRLPDIDESLFPIAATYPGMLLAYWCALEQGISNPDCQRSNLPRYARGFMSLFPPGTH